MCIDRKSKSIEVVFADLRDQIRMDRKRKQAL